MVTVSSCPDISESGITEVAVDGHILRVLGHVVMLPEQPAQLTENML